MRGKLFMPFEDDLACQYVIRIACARKYQGFALIFVLYFHLVIRNQTKFFSVYRTHYLAYQ